MKRITTLLLLAFCAATAHATIYYVDAARPNNAGAGTSWVTAKKDVQAAINAAAVAGDEVWVKAGTYLPTMDMLGNAATPNPRDKTFSIINKNIKLYGGFAGTETLAGQRSPATNVTILSGDLDGAGGTADAYHVLFTRQCSNATSVDGFTLRGARADDGNLFFLDATEYHIHYNGGGMLNANSDVVVSNCTFTGNIAFYGGGSNNVGGSPTYINCTFTNNSTTGWGGGMANYSASPTLTNCNFQNNSSTGDGGGIWCQSGNNIITQCTFTGNSGVNGGGMHSNSPSTVVTNCSFSNNAATTDGGGVYLNTGTNSVSQCTFTGNTAAYGGGIISYAPATNISNCSFSTNNASQVGGAVADWQSAVITSCNFLSNTATEYGGGICTVNNNTSVSGCVFNGNSAKFGGGINTYQGSKTISNCLFTGNSSTTSGGGGIYIESGTAAIDNCTFYNNNASTTGGALYYESNGGGAITNAILYGNAAIAAPAGSALAEISKAGANTALTLSNSIIHGYTGAALPFITTGAAITGLNPMFANTASPIGPDATWRTADDGLALQYCSPAINTGATTAPALATDILANARVGAYDMGAYEYQSSPSSGLAMATTTATLSQAYTTTYGSCGNLIATLQSTGAAPVAGTTTATVYVQPTAGLYNTQPYVRRYYDVSPLAGAATATGTLTLYFTQADFDNYNLNRGSNPSLPVDAADAANYKANLRITQQHGTSTTGTPGTYTGSVSSGSPYVVITPTTVVYNTILSRWETTFPVSGFSGFFAHTGAGLPLAVKLLDFEGSVQGSINQLNWHTAQEDAGTTFHLQRSANGSSFATIGSTAGQGSNSSYTFTDHQPLSPVAYYRLLMHHTDGSPDYSNIIALYAVVKVQ